MKRVSRISRYSTLHQVCIMVDADHLELLEQGYAVVIVQSVSPAVPPQRLFNYLRPMEFGRVWFMRWMRGE